MRIDATPPMSSSRFLAIETKIHIDSYESALAFLNSLDISVLKLGLERIQKVLETLENPQEKLSIIHIAGTNGKGSTSAMLTSIFKMAGLRVGTFTSPHLVDIRERICLNGSPISQTEFTEEVSQLANHLVSLQWDREDWPTYFEFLNILAYRYFLRQGTEINVFETGLGGRLDSTNVIKKPLLCIITTISYDHTERLGNTLSAIAREKAGIIKPKVPVIIGHGLSNEALTVLRTKADEQKAPWTQPSFNRLREQGLSLDLKQQFYDEQTKTLLKLSLLGRYQKQNLLTVLEVIEQLKGQGIKIPQKALEKGLEEAYWPARFQYLKQKNLIIDGSHNPEGFQSLEESVRTYFSNRPLFWVLSLRNNRQPDDLISVIKSFPETQGILWTSAERQDLYHPPEAMAELTQNALNLNIPIEARKTTEKALQWVSGFQTEKPCCLGILTGSLYTAGEFLNLLQPIT